MKKDCECMVNNAVTDCFFDLYGTLVDIHTNEGKIDVWHEVRKEILHWDEGCRLSSEQMRDCFFWSQNYMRRFCKDDSEHQVYPEMNLFPVFSYLLSQCGVLPLEERVTKTAKIFRLASIDYCNLYEDTLNFLIKLKDCGKRIWLVTNAQRLFTFPEIERLGLATVFDGIYISSDIGFRKEEKRWII